MTQWYHSTGTLAQAGSTAWADGGLYQVMPADSKSQPKSIGVAIESRAFLHPASPLQRLARVSVKSLTTLFSTGDSSRRL